MTDLTAAPDDAEPTGPEATGPQIRILAQFTRDLSFENPRAPESLRAAQAQPQIELGVEMSARGRPDQLFEVDLKLSATAKHEGEVSFAVELVYGGLFQIMGVPEAELEAVLLIECPRFLFPFARRIIADASAEGGFPPLLLEPIDFAGVYQSQRQQAAALDAAGPPVGTA
jgi:preprotein translocase subunit SecB